jgi:hypothetical protein
MISLNDKGSKSSGFSTGLDFSGDRKFLQVFLRHMLKESKEGKFLES